MRWLPTTGVVSWLTTVHPDDVVSDDGTVLWRELLAEASERLSATGNDGANNDARRIVERASGTEGAEYFTILGTPATQRGVHYFDLMLQRRLVGEPLQYVLGRWAFRTLDLIVDRRVLIPRPETEVVAQHAIDALIRMKGHGARQRPVTAVDLGTGSGAIALSIAVECAGVDVWATDVSADALAVSRANLTGIGRGATRVRLMEGSWFDALPRELCGSIDLVVSNPPYVAESDHLPAEVVDWEPREALFAGPTGMDALKHIVEESVEWLARPGVLVVELAPGQGEALAETASRAGFNETGLFDDLAGLERGMIAKLD